MAVIFPLLMLEFTHLKEYIFYKSLGISIRTYYFYRLIKTLIKIQNGSGAALSDLEVEKVKYFRQKSEILHLYTL